MSLYLPHLETNVTLACQNRCIACNHFVPMQIGRFAESMIPVHVLGVDLANMARLVHVEAYALIGGEPTLHPEIDTLLELAVASRIARTVQVWTNGQSLRRLSDKFWYLVQELVVTAYPGKITEEELHWIQQRCLDSKTIFRLNDERNHPNFTQLLEPKPTAGRVTEDKYKACWFKTFSRVIDWGVFYRCCTSPFIPQLLQSRPVGSDGLVINEDTTEEMLQEFLDRPTAMESCHICAGRNTPSARPIPWEEIRDPRAWLNASSGRPR